ncbi:N-acetyltransferase [Herminiimonas sp. KBW02]|uniref:GNAT family N-acetyltransferase n=1 Tax=Herminiimonas sp. KBW02 TaxID=2153363 RepID=UPI000F594540|nr:GNAT family protein [Herminiimonas sp. KBW02]RQO37342.1 N-acetyltransferase [Herminiimonas sp. KBW02]
MSDIDLIQINVHGKPVGKVGVLSDIARQVCAATTRLYADAGFAPPWLGYLAQRERKLVGACAFKAPPQDGKVEIGYITFPDYEGQGVATAMVQQLLLIAQAAQPRLTVIAHTANEENASNAILTKFGFQFTGVSDDAENGQMWIWQLLPDVASPA